MKRVCVFAGSSIGSRDEYVDAARALGWELAARHIELVYGGGNVGLMGILANAVLEAGGYVIGVIPRTLVEKELAHRGLPDLRIVGSMHKRKALMAELSEGFVALPGGLGTLEELFEILTWAQLGMHEKPCGLLNVCGYFDNLMQFLDDCVAERFLEKPHRSMLIVEREPKGLLDRFEHYRAPVVERWIDRTGI